MENQTKQEPRDNETLVDTLTDTEKELIRTRRLQEVPKDDLAVRPQDPEQVDTSTRSEGLYTERIEETLATRYDYETALKEYDRKESNPQIAEHWEYSSPNLKRYGHL